MALSVAERIGYPVVLKASAGGGGRGIRVVNSEAELIEKLPVAIKEAEVAFGDGSIYIVIADEHGNVVTLGERECSIQRRHQKLIEEAPSGAVTEKKRKELEDMVREFCREIGYVGAGTVEFLMDEDGNFYFMEMNGRIQVEHPVTEMVTGVDIVKHQIRVAMGERLNIKKVVRRGYAIEFRINAEDPVKFMPSPGTVDKLILPGGFGVRFDTHIYQGYKIPPYYDSLIGKLIVWGETREEAISRGRRALSELIIEGRGLSTNREFHLFILERDEFIEGE